MSGTGAPRIGAVYTPNSGAPVSVDPTRMCELLVGLPDVAVLEVLAVNPNATTVSGDPAVADLASVPGEFAGDIVMVNTEAAVDVVRECAKLGVPRVWLFKGIGGAGAVSDEAIELCRQHGINVIEGACPLMFLEPVGWFHRLHRSARRINGSLARSA